MTWQERKAAAANVPSGTTDGVAGARPVARPAPARVGAISPRALRRWARLHPGGDFQILSSC